MPREDLHFGKDYYFNEDGFMVFTAAYLLKRGYCCESGCRHCPYGFDPMGPSRAEGATGLSDGERSASRASRRPRN
ncbi:MAG TPA: DUF5522 domain-containing protein [bacterium]|nr:DUF5522 domain-containing protein [bacterium]